MLFFWVSVVAYVMNFADAVVFFAGMKDTKPRPLHLNKE